MYNEIHHMDSMYYRLCMFYNYYVIYLSFFISYVIFVIPKYSYFINF